jgi:N-acyl-L-homoserine lactone synthetase
MKIFYSNANEDLVLNNPQERVEVVSVDPSSPQDQALCNSFYALRDEVFVIKNGWFEPREERDQYDQASVFFLALEGGRVVAGLRAIYQARLPVNESLPIETCFDGKSPVHLGAIELSRMINKGKPDIGLLVYRTMYQQLVIVEGHRSVYAVIRRSFLRSLQRCLINLTFDRLPGSSKWRGKSERVPVRIGVARNHFQEQECDLSTEDEMMQTSSLV